MLTRPLYTNWDVPCRLVQQVYNSENAHDSTPPQGENSDSNSILVHPLYGCIQLSDFHRRMGATVFVHKLGSAAAPHPVGAQFR